MRVCHHRIPRRRAPRTNEPSGAIVGRKINSTQTNPCPCSPWRPPPRQAFISFWVPSWLIILGTHLEASIRTSFRHGALYHSRVEYSYWNFARLSLGCHRLVSLRSFAGLAVSNPCQSISSFLSAYDSGIAGGILTYKSFEKDFGYATRHESKVSSLTVGLEQLGSFIAAGCVYPLTNKYGRKLCIIGSTALFVIGVIIQVINTRSLAAWYVGRIVAGLGMGGQSVVIPMYSAEMTPKEIRGRCGSFYQWLYAWGVFVAYWVNYVSVHYYRERIVTDFESGRVQEHFSCWYLARVADPRGPTIGLRWYFVHRHLHSPRVHSLAADHESRR